MRVRALELSLAAAALSAACLVASSASAAAVVFSQTFDLTTAIVTATSVTSNNNTGFTPTLSNGSPFTAIANGDSFDYTVTFKSGQGVLFTGPSGDFGLFQIGLITPNFGTLLNGNAGSTLRLFDTTGATITTLHVNGFTSTQPKVLGDTFGPIGVPVSGALGGLEFFNPSVSGLDASPFFNSSVVSLTATSGGLQVVSVAVNAPEPAAWALMVIGFGAAGATLRRRRALA